MDSRIENIRRFQAPDGTFWFHATDLFGALDTERRADHDVAALQKRCEDAVRPWNALVPALPTGMRRVKNNSRFVRADAALDVIADRSRFMDGDLDVDALVARFGPPGYSPETLLLTRRRCAWYMLDCLLDELHALFRTRAPRGIKRWDEWRAALNDALAPLRAVDFDTSANDIEKELPGDEFLPQVELDVRRKNAIVRYLGAGAAFLRRIARSCAECDDAFVADFLMTAMDEPLARRFPASWIRFHVPELQPGLAYVYDGPLFPNYSKDPLVSAINEGGKRFIHESAVRLRTAMAAESKDPEGEMRAVDAWRREKEAEDPSLCAPRPAVPAWTPPDGVRFATNKNCIIVNRTIVPFVNEGTMYLSGPCLAKALGYTWRAIASKLDGMTVQFDDWWFHKHLPPDTKYLTPGGTDTLLRMMRRRGRTPALDDRGVDALRNILLSQGYPPAEMAAILTDDRIEPVVECVRRLVAICCTPTRERLGAWPKLRPFLWI